MKKMDKETTDRLKQSDWEFAHEICKNWEASCCLLESAFFALLQGDTQNEAVRTVKNATHEDRWSEIVAAHRKLREDAHAWRQYIKSQENRTSDL